MTSLRKILLCLIVAVMVAAGCSDDSDRLVPVGLDPIESSDDSSEPEPAEPDEPAESGPEATDSEPTDADAGEVTWDATGFPAETVAEILEKCPDSIPFAPVDLWSDVVGQVSSSIESLVKQRTAHLLQVNPTSCRSFDQASALVPAEAVGAIAVQGFVHADPDLRWDIFVFAEGVDTARDAVTAAITDATPEGEFVRVSALGRQIFLAASSAEEFAFRSDGDKIDNFYGRFFAGEE